MSNQQLTTKTYAIDKPAEVTKMAKVLKNHIVHHKLYTPIVGKNYVHVEGWTFAGGLMGLFPRIREVEDMSKGNEYKWKATAEIINMKTGEVMSIGIALCSNKENKKRALMSTPCYRWHRPVLSERRTAT